MRQARVNPEDIKLTFHFCLVMLKPSVYNELMLTVQNPSKVSHDPHRNETVSFGQWSQLQRD